MIFTALADALKVNAVLKILNLYNNRIGPTGATALAEALKFSAVLNNLDLRLNSIGDTGAAALGEALKFNASLTKVCVPLRCPSFCLAADGQCVLPVHSSTSATMTWVTRARWPSRKPCAARKLSSFSLLMMMTPITKSMSARC